MGPAGLTERTSATLKAGPEGRRGRMGRCENKATVAGPDLNFEALAVMTIEPNGPGELVGAVKDAKMSWQRWK